MEIFCSSSMAIEESVDGAASILSMPISSSKEVSAKDETQGVSETIKPFLFKQNIFLVQVTKNHNYSSRSADGSALLSEHGFNFGR